ncbi:DNA circularization N-terminal domain-containing protein [Serratia sp. UGAL515B_01]|uniref:DNA circularization protein n=1 Tax=Serratia sp. UGAL515B_01 TaxID=2986763 RepID=UPI002954E752|nr:DNA circularization N-terminal domain-containing protein [Serratia sp. UGAL515B_01]WON77840.1 DNA circularization N-terminal domain-containing protein [Serratia sp. UGAL515B_01]
MSWKDKLLPASFRGVPFKTKDDEATVGRRTQTHEYPNRDKPYSEDLGRVTRRDRISAYVIGDDYQAQRDQLIAAINQGGPGKLIHPQYGELNVCIDGEVTVSHSSSDGRMCTISFAFVEAGELSFPTSGVATGQKLISSTDAMTDSASDAFGKSFGLDGLPDFLQNGVLENAHDMTGIAIKALDGVNSAMGDAGRLLDGDMSVLLMPPSSGMDFTNRLQRMWRSGNALFRNSGDVISKIKGLTGFTVDRNLAPRGVWKTDSKTTQIQTAQTNAIAQAMRTTALAEAARSVSSLPQPLLAQTGNTITQARLPQRPETGTDTQPVRLPLLTHPAVTSLDDGAVTEPPLSYDTLTEIRDTLNNALDHELLRVTDDRLFLALNTVRADVNRDISQRLEQTEKTALLTPTDVLPALVLAADWYDSSGRERDILGRNPIIHPGFVPVVTLKVPVR